MTRRMRVPLWLIPAGVLAAITLAVASDWWTALPPETVARYVGRDSCIDCHREQAEAFHGSHHDLAMDWATDDSVLGDFSGVELEHHGVRSRMFRDGDRFMVHTEGPDGEMADFEIKYVFGVDPLQQYMVEFDRPEGMPEQEISRLQVLRISWDTHGRRWFHLDPPDVQEKLDPDDDLHWTGIAQRWQTMCADCHSTNLQKNYDHDTGLYHTTFSEIDVSCEACHGPGSIHVDLAQQRSLFWDRRFGYGLARLKGDDPEPQLQACAPCHSRRSMIQEGFRPGDSYHDFYDLARLEGELYHADGQILDEVYAFGSFVQSKMYHQGIRCSDCHDPHSLQLKGTGNTTCTSCHAHPAGKYDTPSHHRHEPGTPGAACVSCHMPSTTYMAVDPRRDHSLRIPRPDLSVSLGTPNACTGCHLEQERLPEASREGLEEYADWLRRAREGDEAVQAELDRLNRWCDAACDQWYGEARRREPHFAEARVALQRGEAGAARRLADLARAAEVTPAIARATLLEDLSRAGERVAVAAASELLEDASPIVRAAALRALEGQSAPRLRRAVAPRLADESRLVRIEAARRLADAEVIHTLSAAERGRFQDALDELHAGLMANNDRSGAHMAWALLCERMGRIGDAVRAYETAIRVEPRSVGPRSNLATLLEQQGSMQAAAGRLTAAEQERLGQRVGQLRRQELPLLERDAVLAPESAPLQHRLGLALYLDGQWDAALERLRRAVELEPQEPTYRFALALLLQRLDQLEEAREIAEALLRADPQHPDYRGLWQSLRPGAPPQ